MLILLLINIICFIHPMYYVFVCAAGDPTYADIKFIAEGRSVYAHRFMLEQSSDYFKVLFRTRVGRKGEDTQPLSLVQAQIQRSEQDTTVASSVSLYQVSVYVCLFILV